MAEKKRWIAMYTKHIKQKRKVYHDGFLDLQITRRKVMLYDEADNLLESRMLKADEVVSSGATLTFQAYLVDICDPKEGSSASSDPKVQPSDQGYGRKSFAVLRPNFKKSEERKPNFVNKFPEKSLSPSHKMIRVFKKRELHKYASLSPDTVKPTTKGTVPLGSAGKESNNHPFPLINSSSDDSKLSKKVPPQKPLRDESDTRKSHKVESIPSRAASRDSLPQQLMVRETSSASTTDSSITHLSDPPSFDLGI